MLPLLFVVAISHCIASSYGYSYVRVKCVELLQLFLLLVTVSIAHGIAIACGIDDGVLFLEGTYCYFNCDCTVCNTAYCH